MLVGRMMQESTPKTRTAVAVFRVTVEGKPGSTVIMARSGTLVSCCLVVAEESVKWQLENVFSVWRKAR